MVTNDATIIKIKHKLICEAAKMAYAGEFDEKKDQLPYMLIPGPQPMYRCCIYKEREVVRERTRLVENKNAGMEDNGLVVQVIKAACEGCPISRYVVTDNCQKCMGKACQSSCNFGAISIGRSRAYIDPSKCRECGKCAAACPYNAIADLIRPCKRNCPVDAISMDENAICTIDESKCIQCGRGRYDRCCGGGRMVRGTCGRKKDDNLLLPCICTDDQKALSNADRQYFHDDLSDVRGIPYDQSKRSGCSDRIYRPLYCKEGRDFG